MFEDPDITLKAFRDMLNGEERPSSPENLEGPLRISSGKDPPDYGPSGGPESTDARARFCWCQFVCCVPQLNAIVVFSFLVLFS